MALCRGLKKRSDCWYVSIWQGNYNSISKDGFDGCTAQRIFDDQVLCTFGDLDRSHARYYYNYKYCASTSTIHRISLDSLFIEGIVPSVRTDTHVDLAHTIADGRESSDFGLSLAASSVVVLLECIFE